jgi:hypothetical protein
MMSKLQKTKSAVETALLLDDEKRRDEAAAD